MKCPLDGESCPVWPYQDQAGLNSSARPANAREQRVFAA